MKRIAVGAALVVLGIAVSAMAEPRPQGTSLNGKHSQGTSLNGKHSQGTSFNGKHSQGRDLGVEDATGLSLEGVRVEGGRLVR